MKKLFTIGYEGKTPEEFFLELKQSGVRCLLDIRIRPQSRKPGFSKRALQERCGAEGLIYLHERDLGTPERILAQFKKTGFYDWDSYKAFLMEQTEALERARNVAENLPTCLLCYERDFNVCHRRYVAEEMVTSVGLTVVHL